MMHLNHKPTTMKKQAANTCTSYHPAKSRKCSKEDSPKGPSPRNRTVRFSETSVLVITRPKTSNDLKATWYSRKDLVQFKQCARADAQILSQTTSLENVINRVAYSAATGEGTPQAHTATIQGLELMNGIEHLLAPQVLRVLLQRRKKTIATVLEEDRAQLRLGTRDPQRLASVSSESSGFSKELRQRIAFLR